MGRKNKKKPDPAPRSAEVAASGATPAAAAAASAAKPERQLGLKVLVLVAGAVLMGLEIVGSRLVAPTFGNSVFVWGSLIGVFLTALSAGYYAGGYLADRKPSFGLLLGICLGAAALILFIPVPAPDVCKAFERRGEQMGPLLASLVLFLPPSFLLGMVSPFSVRLATRSFESVGRSAGTLYALSTLGSIVGTMVTTFVLIPSLEVPTIFKGLGGAMLVVAALLFVLRPGALPAVAAAVLIGLAAWGAKYPPAAPIDRARYDVVLEEDTPYHHIAVLDTKDGQERLLKFDRFVESSISLSPPYESRSPYTDYFHLAFLPRGRIGSTLFIGAGGGIGPRAFHAMDPEMEIDVVDIDRRVLEIAERQFHMPVGDKVRPHALDGRMFVARSERTYDCIVLDAFSIGGRIPFHLVTREFFELCRSKMPESGVFVMNINSALEGPRAEIYRSVARTLREVFPHVHSFALAYRYLRGVGTTTAQRYLRDSTNVIFVALPGGDDLDPAGWRARIGSYPEKSWITRDTVREMVEDLVWPRPELEDVDPFTDAYAPIETMRFTDP